MASYAIFLVAHGVVYTGLVLWIVRNSDTGTLIFGARRHFFCCYHAFHDDKKAWLCCRVDEYSNSNWQRIHIWLVPLTEKALFA